MHLRQPWFTYSTCRPCTKSKGRIKIYKEEKDSKCIYQNELDKGYFQHDFNMDLVPMGYKFFDKKISNTKRNTKLIWHSFLKTITQTN